MLGVDYQQLNKTLRVLLRIISNFAFQKLLLRIA